MRGFISGLFLPAASEVKTTLLFPTPGCAPPGKKAGKEKGGVGIVYARVAGAKFQPCFASLSDFFSR